MAGGYFYLRQSLPVYWFLVALVLVGTGYLVTTGGASDIGRATLRGLGGGMAMVPSFGG